MALQNRHIILGITGGIAAYKSAELTRLLVKAGAEVQVVMTTSAEAFITPLTFQALSGRETRTTLFDPAHEAAMGHIELARWADLILIAPASANTLARLAHGMADDLLTTLCLASSNRLAVAPAMNRQMWANAATQHNLQILQQREVHILGPDSGEQACGDTGPGRMLEPADIMAQIKPFFSTGHLDGKRVMITAGPTREPIDPVRYLSNRSSGKMGVALAQAALDAGATVTLITGPITIGTPDGVNRINVETAEQMHNAVMANAGEMDILIATAAVSDYRPATPQDRKIKKSARKLDLKLVRNPDILATVARTFPQVFCVGFAAETHDLSTYAKQKLEHKGLDMIAANPVHDGLGFDRDDNSLQVFWPGGEQSLPSDSKSRLAVKLIELIAARYQQQGSDHASS
jgi:phosphopantothenoylcysteine decarboxylase/phosphopantothenate--cysteine ligase